MTESDVPELDEDGPPVPLDVLAGARSPVLRRLRRQNFWWLLGFAGLTVLFIFLPSQVPDVTVFNEVWFAVSGAAIGFLLTTYFAVKSARNPAAKLRPHRRAVLANRRTGATRNQKVQSWAIFFVVGVVGWFVAPWAVTFFVAMGTGALALGLLRLMTFRELFGPACLDPQVFGYYVGHKDDPVFRTAAPISSDEVLTELPDLAPLRQVPREQWPFQPVQPTAGSYKTRLRRLLSIVIVGMPILMTLVVWLAYFLGESFRYSRYLTSLPMVAYLLVLIPFLLTLKRRNSQRREEAKLGYTTVLEGLFETADHQ
jgi:hypothetical protein